LVAERVDREALLKEMYVAFNGRDIDAVFARMHPTGRGNVPKTRSLMSTRFVTG
jgi:hypothetical protein